jgi:hypothetical protein
VFFEYHGEKDEEGSEKSELVFSYAVSSSRSPTWICRFQACTLSFSARLFVHRGSSEPGCVGLGAGFKHENDLKTLILQYPLLHN